MLEEIFEWFGSQKGLAIELEVTEAAISIWKRDGVPARRAIEIEEITGGKFLAKDIIRIENEDGVDDE